MLNLALGVVKPQVSHAWKSGGLLLGITCWAKLGNSLFAEHNWFFLEEDALYIGLVANGVIPKWALMVINPLAFFLAVLILYGVCCGVRTVYVKKKTAVACVPC